MTACNRPGCFGAIDETGFCDACDRRPPGSSERSPAASRRPRSWSRPGKSTGASRTIEGFLSTPVLEFPDPGSRVIDVPEVPERNRFCECGAELGRGYAGQPPLVEGYCPYDREQFSFTPPNLRPGERVDARYEVVGCVGRGGLGWVYLARDCHLDDTYVALKRLINPTGAAAALAVAERQFLIALDHPNLVRISNFVTHRETHSGEPIAYIVMEFLNGVPLADMKTHVYEYDEPLRFEHLLGYGLEILAAFEYLHGRGLLYCDMKPDNVIRCADRVKVIDLGGVRRVGDRASPAVGTPGFQVSPDEIRRHGLSVQSDLHTIGRTLADLYCVTEESQSAGRVGQGSLGLGIESFHRLVRRATDPDRALRFGSAAEMAEQLKGVAREVVALREQTETPQPSRLFAPTAELLDAGLGAVTPIARWTEAGHAGVLDPGRPPPAAAAARFPTPRVAPDDLAARFLEGALDPISIIEKVPAFQGSIEIQFAACRAYLEMSDLDRATGRLAAASDLLGDPVVRDWRVAWHRGLIALASGDLRTATAEFDAVYSAVPGETAPKLALGFCAELAGGDAMDRAERYYQALWWRDRSLASAAFGLARVRLSRMDRAGAVEILDEVPRISRHYDAARIAAFQVLSGRLSADTVGLPTDEDLQAALGRLSDLHLDGGADHGEARERLVAALREMALQRILVTGKLALSGGGRVLGEAPDERRLRVLLERSYRALAFQAQDLDAHGVLVDLANVVRPKTLR